MTLLDLWIVDLSVTAGGAERVLSTEELRRADRFALAEHRRRFVAARAAVRAILGDWLGVRPEAVAFAYGPQGAPRLSEPRTDLRFSTSRSGECGVVAITNGRRIGVDVEVIDGRVNTDGIAAHYFHPGELARLGAGPADLRRVAFFAHWTAKEAYIKALGVGLSKPLNQFEVDVPAGGQPQLLRDGSNIRPEWTLRRVDLGPGLAAAVAVEGRAPKPRVRSFRPDRRLAGPNDVLSGSAPESLAVGADRR